MQFGVGGGGILRWRENINRDKNHNKLVSTTTGISTLYGTLKELVTQIKEEHLILQHPPSVSESLSQSFVVFVGPSRLTGWGVHSYAFHVSLHVLRSAPSSDHW